MGKKVIPGHIPKAVLEVFPFYIVDTYSIMPIRFSTRRIDEKTGLPAVIVAFEEELELPNWNIRGTLRDIEFMIGRKITPVYAPREEICAAIGKYYKAGGYDLAVLLDEVVQN